MGDFDNRDATALEYRRVSGGLLVQDRDDQADPEDEYKVVTERQPTAEELKDLKFGWKVCKHVKSNAILFAKGLHGGWCRSWTDESARLFVHCCS